MITLLRGTTATIILMVCHAEVIRK